MPPTMELTTTTIQVVKGGNPDDDELGIRLSDVRSPIGSSYSGMPCACGRTYLLYRLWEDLKQYDLFSRGTDLWLRAVDGDDAPPLPAGAAVIDQRTVMLGIG
ncbi:hypothetical protein ACFOVU_13560 [Nocardiopsis sediminis]|uniref:Uncharacterized protein n=1 Tax=Nocardiopsis sediminis TaxID=1778267 RepID=A0ABV8FLF7_9ACTN